MPSRLIIAIITLLWIKGVYLNKEKQVSQTPTQMLLKPNEQVNLSLTHHISSYDTILWYQRSAGDTSLKLIGYMYFKTPTVEPTFQSHFNVSGDGEKTAYLHILKPRHPEDSGEYFGAASKGDSGGGSEAHFGGGTKLTVLESGRQAKPPTVKVLPPSLNECRNKKDSERRKTLVCVASEFYPDHVSVFWQIDGDNVTEGVATDDAALRPEGERNYKITSRLRVSAESWFTPTQKFKCVVEFYNGKAYETYEDSINGVEAPAKGNAITREKYLRVTQTAKLSYAVFIVKSSIYGAFVAFLVWKLQGKQNN